MRSVEVVLGLVVLATVVAVTAHRLRVPPPSLLVLAGLLVGSLSWMPAVRVPPQIVSLVVLPPLLYAAGEDLSWRMLRQVWRPVTLLAFGLVGFSAAAVGAVAAVVTELPASLAFLLGTVLASTDPVAVTALGRRLALPPRVQTLVQAESLFNDATSLLLFRIAVIAAVAGGGLSWGGAAGMFGLLAGGGVLAGGLVAGGVSLIRRRTEDPVLETVIALITPYAAYVLAEAGHASGVTAVVTAAVILGRQTSTLTTANIRLQLSAVYGTVVFLLESVVFSLIGLELPTLIRGLARSGEVWFWPALLIAATLIAVRVAWVFPLSFLAQYRRGTRRPSWQVPAVVSWAGARGVVPLAATLSIPLTVDSGAPLAGRDLVVVLATSVIVISLIVQGFTLAPLVRRTGVAIPASTAQREYALARLRTAQAALGRLQQLEDVEGVPEVVAERLRTSLVDRIEVGELHLTGEGGRDGQDRDGQDRDGQDRDGQDRDGQDRDGQDRDGQDRDGQDDVTAITAAYQAVRRDLIAAESAELSRLHDVGEIGETTRRAIQRMLDLQEAALNEER